MKDSVVATLVSALVAFAIGLVFLFGLDVTVLSTPVAFIVGAIIGVGVFIFMIYKHLQVKRLSRRNNRRRSTTVR